MRQQGIARYRTPLALAGLVGALAGVIAWDQKRATTDEMEARRQNVFRAFHRERVDKIEVERNGVRFELRKERDDWFVVSNGTRRAADPIEAERLLSEVEGAEPQRSLGTLDAASRGRFGLDRPRARVTIHEGPEVTARFALGGAVEREEAVYVEASAATGGRDNTALAVVLPKTFGQPFDRTAVEFRDRKVADVDAERVTRIELQVDGQTRAIERRGAVWRLVTPDLGRAARGAVEAITSELNELRATRVLADDVAPGGLAQWGLDRPRVRAEFRRSGNVEPVVLRFGNVCPEHADEFAATREGTGTVVCFGRGLVDSLRVAPEGFRDDHVLAARTDEIGEVRIKGAGTGGVDLVLRRGGTATGSASSGWRAEGSPWPVDAESIEAWLGTLHDVSTTQRLATDERAARGLSPAQTVIEVSRTGVEGIERIHVGLVDAAGLYVSRDDEPVVLQFPPSLEDTLRVEAVRFRPRAVIRDTEDELRALLVDVGPMHEEVARVDGVLRLSRPVALAADPSLSSDLVRPLAALDADRWVSATARPEHGLAQPRARLVARFEGTGPREEGDAGSDAAMAPVRSYTVSFGASAPGGGVFATLEGTPGVFVAPRSVFDALSTPHLDRGALRVVASVVSRLTLTVGGPTPRRVVLVKTGSEWRTDAGTPVDAQRVDALLNGLAGASAPRVFGYGAAPAEAGMATPRLVVEAAGEGDAGQQSVRLVVGERFGAGDGAGFYARRDGLDATLSLPESVVEALVEFRP
jgi:hypothetical protein